MTVAITVTLCAEDPRTDDEIIALYVEDPNEFFNRSTWEFIRGCGPAKSKREIGA